MRYLKSILRLETQRSLFTFGVLLSSVLLSGCGGVDRSREPSAQTAVPLKSFALYDVHTRWGGYALWAKKDGLMIIQVVEPAGLDKLDQLREKRYQLQTRPGQLSEVEQIVGSNKFLELKSSKAAETPSEDRVSIMVVTGAGATVKVSRWGKNHDIPFAHLYEYLRGICRDVEGQQKPVYEGEYHRNWRPAGFEQPW